MASNENWKTINGVHVLIDDKGNIVKGPKKFLGKSIDSISKVSEKIDSPSRKVYGTGVNQVKQRNLDDYSTSVTYMSQKSQIKKLKEDAKKKKDEPKEDELERIKKLEESQRNYNSKLTSDIEEHLDDFLSSKLGKSEYEELHNVNLGSFAQIADVMSKKRGISYVESNTILRSNEKRRMSERIKAKKQDPSFKTEAQIHKEKKTSEYKKTLNDRSSTRQLEYERVHRNDVTLGNQQFFLNKSAERGFLEAHLNSGKIPQSVMKDFENAIKKSDYTIDKVSGRYKVVKK